MESTANLLESLKSIDKKPFSLANSLPLAESYGLTNPKEFQVRRGQNNNTTARTSQWPSTAGRSTAGPSTAGHSTAGHSTAGHSTAGHSTAGHSTAGHSTAGHSTAGHSTAGAIQSISTSRERREIKRAVPVDAFLRSKESSQNYTLPHTTALDLSDGKVHDKYPSQKYETLKKKHSNAFRDVQKIEAKTELCINDALTMIPAHYFVSHKMFDQIKSKALDSVLNILKKMRIRLLRQGIAIWREKAVILTEILLRTSAMSISRMVRGFIGRRRAARLHRARVLEMKSRSKTEAIAAMNKHERATLIQTAYRGWVVRHKYQSFIRRHRAAISIQRYFVNYRNSERAAELMEEVIGRIRAAKLIQRCFRGLLGRMATRARRSELHRERLSARYETPEGIFEFYFEQNGAAMRIQKWYKSLWWVMLMRGDERRAKHERMLHGKARKIQKVVRGMIGRKKAAKQREIRKLQAKIRLNIVITVQSAVRKFLVLRKNKDIVSRLKRAKQRRMHAVLHNSTKRRDAISFDHLKIGSERNIMRMERKARMIQRTYKSFRMLRYFTNMVKNSKIILVCRIQSWYRTWVRRYAVRASVDIIQPVWRFKVHWYRKRNNAAMKIQHAHKQYRSMKWFRDWRRNVRNNANRLQQWAYHRLWVRARRLRLHKVRLNDESRLAGERLYSKTELYALIDEVWRRLAMTRTPLPKHEPQTVFMSYCPQGLLDSGKAFKMVKECKGLLETPRLTIKTVEMIFTKVKGTGGRGLDFVQFLEFLYHIACMKYYGIDASTLHNTSAGSDKQGPSSPPKSRKAISRLESIAQNNEIINSFTFGRLSGRRALIVKLVLEYVSKNAVYVKADTTLEAHSAIQTSKRKIDDSLYVLQRMFRLAIFLNGLYKVRLMANARKLNIKRHESAVKIQARIRGYLGRRMGVRISQMVYAKFIDVDSGAEFWTNKRLGTSQWVKPALLRELDCGDAIKMPTSDEQYTPLCSDCNIAAATCFCDECDRQMCDPCFASMHRSGVRKSHNRIAYEMCVECEFQVPTKECIPCDEVYCDTCFQFAHRRGRARLHTFRWVSEHCDHCDDRAGHWRRVDTYHGYQEEILCTVCYKASYGDPLLEDYTGQYQTYPVTYYGPTVLKYRRKRDEAEAKRKKEEEYAKLMAETLIRKREKGAVTIQRVYRATRVRRSIIPFISKRRIFLAMREKEMPKREKIMYRCRDFFGLAPSLKSDTNKEKVLRVFPKYLRRTVLECVERKWGIYCELLKPPDLGPNAAPPDKISFAHGMAALTELMYAKMSLFWAESRVKRKFRAHERARERYRAARSSATAKPEKKKKLQTYAHDCLKRFQNAQSKRDEEVDNVAHARKRWEHFAGPRSLHNLVEKRREEGVPMPFTVQLTAGSRYAHVTYDTPSQDASNDYAEFPKAPGSWKKKLKTGDIVKIYGMHFKIVAGEDILDILDEFEGYEDGDDESTNVDTVDKSESEHGLRRSESTKRSLSLGNRKTSKFVKKTSSKTPSAVSSVEEPDDEASVEDTETEALIAGNKQLSRGFSMASRASRVIEEIGEDHIKLDRPWLFEDATSQSIYRVAHKPFYARPAFKASRRIHESWFAQKAVTLLALMLNDLSKSVIGFSKLYDEDSEMGASIAEYGKRIGETRDWLIKTSRKNINFDYEFQIKKMLAKGGRFLFSMPKEMIQNAYDNYMRYRANAKLSPYRRWEKSFDKSTIAVWLESGFEDRTCLGSIEMDLDAPVDILRIYIERNFREELNEICGRGFSFFVKNESGAEELLTVDQEELKWSRDFCPIRENPDTGEKLHSVTIVMNEGELLEDNQIEEVFSDGEFEDDEDDEDMEDFEDAAG